MAYKIAFVYISTGASCITYELPRSFMQFLLFIILFLRLMPLIFLYSFRFLLVDCWYMTPPNIHINRVPKFQRKLLECLPHNEIEHAHQIRNVRCDCKPVICEQIEQTSSSKDSSKRDPSFKRWTWLVQKNVSLQVSNSDENRNRWMKDDKSVDVRVE